MRKSIYLFLGSLLLAAGANAEPKNYNFSGEKPDSPRVLAAYQEQCEQWAAEQGGGVDRNAFVEQCKTAMPQVWPVGYEEE